MGDPQSRIQLKNTFFLLYLFDPRGRTVTVTDEKLRRKIKPYF